MSEKLENKNKRRRGLPGPPLPCAAQQQQAGPARRRPSPPGPLPCRLPPLPGGRACARRSPARARATSPPCWPPPASPDSLDAPDEATQLPRTALTLPRPPLLPLLSLPLTREPPPPPTGITVATGLPSPPRPASELRHNPLHLLVELRTSRTCCNTATIAVSAAGHRSSLRSIRRLPETTELLIDLAVSSSSISPSPRARSRTPAAFSPEPIAPRRRPWRCRGQGHPS